MRTRHAADLHLSSVSRLVHLENSKSQIVSVTFRLSFLAMRDWLLTLYLFSSPPSHLISWLIWNINIPGHACAHTFIDIYIKRVYIYIHTHSFTYRACHVSIYFLACFVEIYFPLSLPIFYIFPNFFVTDILGCPFWICFLRCLPTNIALFYTALLYIVLSYQLIYIPFIRLLRYCVSFSFEIIWMTL